MQGVDDLEDLSLPERGLAGLLDGVVLEVRPDEEGVAALRVQDGLVFARAATDLQLNKVLERQSVVFWQF